MCGSPRVRPMVLGFRFRGDAHNLRKYDVYKREGKLKVGILDNINKLFDHRIRLGIMSILAVNESADFTRLKELLDVTDGNLASHIKALEQAEFILVEKSFIGKKPNTSYSATRRGISEFKKHIEALEKLIQKPPSP